MHYTVLLTRCSISRSDDAVERLSSELNPDLHVTDVLITENSDADTFPPRCTFFLAKNPPKKTLKPV